MSRSKTIRLAATVAIAALGLTGGAVHAQAKPPIVARAEQCLRQNVERVVAADRDMASAANFLVTYACAGEVEGARRYERNSAYVEMFTALFKSIAVAPVPGVQTPIASAQGAAPQAGKPPAAKPPAPPPEFKATVDPETGLIILPPSAPGAPANPMAAMFPMMESLFSQVAPDNVPVSLRKLAGELVLAARGRTR